MVVRIMAAKDVYILILSTYEYVTFHGKKKRTYVIKDLDMKRLSWTMSNTIFIKREEIWSDLEKKI